MANPCSLKNASCMSLRAVMATTGSCAWAGGFSARTFFNNSKPFMDGICMSVNNKSKRHCPTRWNTSSGVRQETISQFAFSGWICCNIAWVSCIWIRSSSISNIWRGRSTDSRVAGASATGTCFLWVSCKGSVTKKELPFPRVLSKWISP